MCLHNIIQMYSKVMFLFQIKLEILKKTNVCSVHVVVKLNEIRNVLCKFFNYSHIVFLSA